MSTAYAPHHEDNSTFVVALFEADEYGRYRTFSGMFYALEYTDFEPDTALSQALYKVSRDLDMHVFNTRLDDQLHWNNHGTVSTAQVSPAPEYRWEIVLRENIAYLYR